MRDIFTQENLPGGDYMEEKDYHKKIACKNCNLGFVINFKMSDQGSIAKCNRLYCCNKCKKAYLKKNGSKNSIKLRCKHCSNVYFKPKSLSINSKFCSRICQNRSYANENQKDRKQINCKVCDKVLSVIENSKRKYCSHKCSHLGQKGNTKIFKCAVCKQEKVILENDNRTYCGRNCQYKAQSLGMIKIPTKGRSGYRIDLPATMYFKSALEADYARYLKFLNIDFKYECKCFELDDSGKKRRYTPDFYIDKEDMFVEMKAGRKDKKFSKNLECVQLVKNRGYNIKVIYMSEFYDMLKKENLYEEIPNIERRNYKKTKHLIRD